MRRNNHEEDDDAEEDWPFRAAPRPSLVMAWIVTVLVLIGAVMVLEPHWHRVLEAAR